jgi:hypothetical protein
VRTTIRVPCLIMTTALASGLVVQPLSLTSKPFDMNGAYAVAGEGENGGGVGGRAGAGSGAIAGPSSSGSNSASATTAGASQAISDIGRANRRAASIRSRGSRRHNFWAWLTRQVLSGLGRAHFRPNGTSKHWLASVQSEAGLHERSRPTEKSVRRVSWTNPAATPIVPRSELDPPLGTGSVLALARLPSRSESTAADLRFFGENKISDKWVDSQLRNLKADLLKMDDDAPSLIRKVSAPPSALANRAERQFPIVRRSDGPNAFDSLQLFSDITVPLVAIEATRSGWRH